MPTPAPAQKRPAAPPPQSTPTASLFNKILFAYEKAKIDAKAGRLQFDKEDKAVAERVNDFVVLVVRRGKRGGNSSLYDAYVDRPASAIHKKRIRMRSKPDICAFFNSASSR